MANNIDPLFLESQLKALEQFVRKTLDDDGCGISLYGDGSILVDAPKGTISFSTVLEMINTLSEYNVIEEEYWE